MFVWYGDVGYVNSSTTLSSINQITFLDYKCPLGIYQALDETIASTGWLGNNPSSMLSFVRERVGDEVDRFYGIPQIGSTHIGSPKSFEVILPYIPSMPLSCPNTFKYALDNAGGSLKPTCVYFKSLKRLIVDYTIYNFASGVEVIYNVGDDGSLSVNSRNGFGFFRVGLSYSNNAAGVFMLWCLKPGITVDGLSDANNYAFRIRCYYDAGLGFSASTEGITVSDFQSMLNGLFGYTSKPDLIVGDNPYSPGGESGPGGGNGTFDNDSDQIEMPPLPTLSSANTGFTRIYNPTLSQVQALANYLWTDETVIETIWNHIKQYFENPMEAIIGFNLVPVPVPDGGTENFKLMYIDTGVSMTVAASQFVEVDCGTLEVPLYYGSALDYSPYTKISIFLPYIGMVSVNTDEVMGRTMKVTYRVDICSGSCVASIFVDDNPLYQYSGHCAIPIPISAADFSTYVSSTISIGKLTGAAMLAGAGIVAPPPPITASQHTNQTTTTTTTDTARNPSTGRQITTGSQTVVQSTESSSEQSSTKASYNGLTPQSVSNTVGEVISSKPHVEHSGSFSGNSGYLGVRRPYMILQRPRMCMPGNYQQFNGFPCMMSLNLGECTGFTRVQQVHLTGLWATNPEQAEILELLKMGVVL